MYKSILIPLLMILITLLDILNSYFNYGQYVPENAQRLILVLFPLLYIVIFTLPAKPVNEYQKFLRIGGIAVAISSWITLAILSLDTLLNHFTGELAFCGVAYAGSAVYGMARIIKCLPEILFTRQANDH